MTKVIVDGLGSMGSSLAEQLESNNYYVVGIDDNPSTTQIALSENVVNEIGHLDAETVKDADLIILCTPVSVIIKQINTLKQLHLNPDTIIMDIGSTKGEILQAAAGLNNFIGGHPMIGTERKGIVGRDKNMFKGTPFFLIGDDSLAAKVEKLLAPLGSDFQQLSAKEHDYLTAAISALPHLVAYALTDSVDKMLPENKLNWQNRVAGGFSDTTRIAKSNPSLWTDIIMSNKQQILEGLDDMINTLSDYRHDLENGDTESLNKKISKAQEIRKKVGESKNG
ncbi:prephenate dehydrogenase [Companilactobacillus sp.]|jgi:prephenate dehydrogenase|uniref:prephenate dehydrogenase n=1 Tax=Companilactobacillus sp. TaxID=2767905 RepID=UPI0025BFAA97|nr:prephenate dehydrogenase [Companilactobacillus sp.]MCH4009600.1 prephenate dehydrogenase [Companilactobacillus sp.]MCH4052724.1 prephenate dehydrogenase [Companilactobacillus sp.]MCH4077542.1 prephenate dehydrogenase [Companilactobacillus sp.]MCH4126118.1 prephenate dehydrogenase [Companilactobacillus sp.]MCI1311826.1 prephenate dehydrogenase [Companilactobacillus sp.]